MVLAYMCFRAWRSCYDAQGKRGALSGASLTKGRRERASAATIGESKHVADLSLCVGGHGPGPQSRVPRRRLPRGGTLTWSKRGASSSFLISQGRPAEGEEQDLDLVIGDGASGQTERTAKRPGLAKRSVPVTPAMKLPGPGVGFHSEVPSLPLLICTCAPQRARAAEPVQKQEHSQQQPGRQQAQGAEPPQPDCSRASAQEGHMLEHRSSWKLNRGLEMLTPEQMSARLKAQTAQVPIMSPTPAKLADPELEDILVDVWMSGISDCSSHFAQTLGAHLPRWVNVESDRKSSDLKELFVTEASESMPAFTMELDFKTKVKDLEKETTAFDRVVVLPVERDSKLLKRDCLPPPHVEPPSSRWAGSRKPSLPSRMALPRMGRGALDRLITPRVVAPSRVEIGALAATAAMPPQGGLPPLQTSVAKGQVLFSATHAEYSVARVWKQCLQEVRPCIIKDAPLGSDASAPASRASDSQQQLPACLAHSGERCIELGVEGGPFRNAGIRPRRRRDESFALDQDASVNSERVPRKASRSRERKADPMVQLAPAPRFLIGAVTVT